MEVSGKLDLLAASAKYDLSCACGTDGSRVRGPAGRWIYPSVLPDGRRAPLLKVLLTNACTRDCAYCAERQSRDFRRVSFQPAELAQVFVEMVRRRWVMGLFLSSAIPGDASAAMERMIAVAEILRRRHHYRGWMHLKVLPGVERELVMHAARVANRLSVNLEAPTPERLGAIAPGKDHARDLWRPMRWIGEVVKSGEWRCRGQTTQFVVGAAGESDREIVGATARLYREMRLSRVYFSAFQPVTGTPLEDLPPASLDREHRLYQAEFLLRKYGFDFGELIFSPDGSLPLDRDPKAAWAAAHPSFFPVELNRAELDQLLRVPGIGPISARRIVRQRRRGRFTTLEDLRSTGALARRAALYLLLDGRPPGLDRPQQLNLW